MGNSKTTPSPRVNILDAIPELAQYARTSIRLHPRRGEVDDVFASKLGGTIWWPANEEWPTMPSKRPRRWFEPEFTFSDWHWDFPDGTPVPFIPILQISAQDVPEIQFSEGKDLMQLMWLPLDSEGPPYSCIPKLIWRASNHGVQGCSMPDMSLANPMYVPKSCYLTFEHVVEYPDLPDLPSDLQSRIQNWQSQLTEIDFEDPTYQQQDTLYQFELSVCSGNKLGGHVNWMQDPEWQVCDCGRRMDHLLTLTDMEVDAGSWPRWLPIEDRELAQDIGRSEAIVNAPAWFLGGGSMYYFICRSCSDWPIKALYQR